MLIGLLAIWFYLALPKPLFKKTYATVLYDRHGRLLGAKIAGDGQWRFPAADSLPYKFKICLTQYEDAYFYKHPGVNPVSLMKATYQDVKAGKIVRGGSTITMQVMRMSRGNQSRNLYQKLIEIILALRMELSYNKVKILNIYASHAPFGGNVVGLEAAAWRYYGRSPYQLSWGETATLASCSNFLENSNEPKCSTQSGILAHTNMLAWFRLIFQPALANASMRTSWRWSYLSVISRTHC